MSSSTTRLNLFKYDNNTDGKQTFNLNLGLNDNWEKIDEYAQNNDSNITDLDLKIQEKADKLDSDKANVNLSNCTVPYVVACSDVNILPSWWRKWSNGIVEQGGIAASINIGNSVEITLLEEYADTNFTVVTSGQGNVNSDDPIWVSAKTTKTIKIRHTNGGNMDGTLKVSPNWYAYGKGKV